MTLWSSPHPKESTALSLGQVQQSSEVRKIKDLAEDSRAAMAPSSATSFASDGSEDAGFEDGSIDVDMGDETEGIQIDCIQTLTEFDGSEGSPLMADCKTSIPLPPPPIHIGSAYGGNQAYLNLQNSLPSLDRPNSPIQLWNASASSESSRHSTRTPGDVGLSNIGNTCFMNSGLQCLLHTAPLIDFFLGRGEFERSITSLVFQFHSVMNHAWFGYTNSIALTDFKMVLGNKYAQFKDCRQHDCQEFLAVLLDNLHEELKLKAKQKASLTVADSSVSESCIVESVAATSKQVDTTYKATSSTTQRENIANDVVSASDNCSQATKSVSHVVKNPTHKRLKLENDTVRDSDAASDPTSNGNCNAVANEEVSENIKRKSPKSEQQQQTGSTTRASIDSENGSVNQDIENEAEGSSGHIDDDDSCTNNEVINPVLRAQEYWDKYMKENNTVIASTFQGMFKSSVTCSECNFISETYEPFMYLSLPIPRVMEKQMSVTFISMKDRTPIKIDLTLHLMGTVEKLIQEVVKNVENYISDDRAKYAAAEVVNYRIFRVLEEKTQLRNLSTNTKHIYVYELNENFEDMTSNSPSSTSKYRNMYGEGDSSYGISSNGLSSTTSVTDDWTIDETCALQSVASTSTSTYGPMGAPVGGGLYENQDNVNFNRVQCNICLEDYPKSDLKQHRGCSCVLCEECLVKSVEHFQTDGKQSTEGSFVRCAVCLQTVDCKRAFVSLDDSTSYSSSQEFITIPVIFRNEPGTDANNNASHTSGLFGYPWLLRVPSYSNASELVEYIESINPLPDCPHRLLSVKADGKNCGQCVFSSRCPGCELPTEGMISLNSCNSLMISYTDLTSERVAEFQPPEMAIHNELMSSWNMNRSDEPTIDIHDCLKTFSETEHLDAQNPWYCPRCKKNQPATKALSICKFPDHLIVYLKRFVFLDQESNKLNNRLTFPIRDLDVSDYVTEGFATDEAKYNLYSCVCHFGTASAGHYTAFAKNPVTKQWHYFNDDSISDREPADTEYSSAYVLFYERQGRSYSLPSKRHKPLPELNSFNTRSSSYTADTQGTYLPSESVTSGPVRVDGDFINEVNLQVDSTSPSFSFPHTSNAADLLGLEVDEGVGNEASNIVDIREGLGLAESDSVVVTSSTSTTEEEDLMMMKDADLFNGFHSGNESVATTSTSTTTVTTAAVPSSSTSTQHNELSSSSSSTGGADSTSN